MTSLTATSKTAAAAARSLTDAATAKRKNTNEEPPAKIQRRNYSVGKDNAMLEQAVSEWLSESGRYHASNGKARSLCKLAHFTGIPYSILQKYVRGKNETRRPVCVAVGRPRLIEKEEEKFMVDVLAQKDSANEGLSVTKALDMIQYVMSKISRQQACNSFKRTVLPSNKGTLKTKPVVAQSTSTKRSGITAKQPFHWI
jgi:hypothetical protein